MALTVGSCGAMAQFYGNAVPAELLNLQAGDVWFGSVRNEQGAFVADATVVLDNGLIEYVAVTGLDGRFRLVLPEATPVDAISSSCASIGYSRSSVRVRRPSIDATSPVEVSCQLH